MKPRSAAHPRIREVLAVLDSMLAFDKEDRQRTGVTERSEGPVDAFVFHAVIGELTFDDWPEDALRAVVLAFAQHAPAEAFAELLKRVRVEREWLTAYRAKCERDVWPVEQRSAS